ncbi:MAG: hypothetical protein WBN04_08080 [Paracoccaceae bacterium]
MNKFLAALAVSVLGSSGAAMAGPNADFNATFSDTYASYRSALFATNSGNPEKSQQALDTFDAKWTALLSDYSATPPPQYAEDPLWGETLSTVTDHLQQAEAAAAEGKLPASHLALEGIRDAVGDLHARNGIETFSDRMNAYHAEMEHVLETDMTNLDAAAMQSLLERAAVLSYLADDTLQSPPPEVAAGNAEYDALAAAFKASVDQMQTAARSGDPEALRGAAAGLKVPYSKFFLKFG